MTDSPFVNIYITVIQMYTKYLIALLTYYIPYYVLRCACALSRPAP